MPDTSGNGVIRAAGAVVWRPGALGPEIALVHRPRYDDWSYPKGKCRRDEHVLAAAIREVAEETGLRVILGRPLTPSVYQAAGKPKEVRYWVARCVESVGFTPNHEVDEVTWLPADAARDRLTYPRDVALLEEFRSGPARSVPFIVLRHATAGSKSTRDSADLRDLARPLDARGTADSELLADLLASFGQCRVISSAAERCLATVRPYAAAVGVPVEVEPAFTVPSGAVNGADLLVTSLGPGKTARSGGSGGKKSQSAGPPPAPELTSAPGFPPSTELPASSEPLPLPDLPGSPEQMSGLGPPAGAAASGPGSASASQETDRRVAMRAASLAASGVPTLICAHRENLPAMIDAAFTALGSSTPDERPLRKGSFWVLQSAGGLLVSAERHDVSE